MEKSTIYIRRKEDYFGVARKLKVFIDGKHVADLKWGQAIDIHVRPGYHTVKVKMDWCTCKPVGFKLRGGERVAYQVDSGFDESVSNMFLQLYNLFFNASDFFTLTRQQLNDNS